MCVYVIFKFAQQGVLKCPINSPFKHIQIFHTNTPMVVYGQTVW